MSTLQLLDAAGRRRSPATVPGFHAGRPPRNKGFRFPPDPPRVEEIVAVMTYRGTWARRAPPQPGWELSMCAAAARRRCRAITVAAAPCWAASLTGRTQLVLPHAPTSS
jgi:hypothetical protein